MLTKELYPVKLAKAITILNQINKGDAIEASEEFKIIQEFAQIGAAVMWNLQARWNGSISDNEDLEQTLKDFLENKLISVQDFKERNKINRE